MTSFIKGSTSSAYKASRHHLIRARSQLSRALLQPNPNQDWEARVASIDQTAMPEATYHARPNKFKVDEPISLLKHDFADYLNSLNSPMPYQFPVRPKIQYDDNLSSEQDSAYSGSRVSSPPSIIDLTDSDDEMTLTTSSSIKRPRLDYEAVNAGSPSRSMVQEVEYYHYEGEDEPETDDYQNQHSPESEQSVEPVVDQQPDLRRSKRTRLTRQSTSSVVYVQNRGLNNFANMNRKDNMITIHVKCHLDDCSSFFTEKTDLIDHMRTVHGIQKYRCQVENCCVSFKTQHALTSHIQHMHDDLLEFTCGKCSRVYASYSVLAHHHYTDHDVGHFECAVADCQTTGSYRYEISRHFEQEHRSYQCSFTECSRMFKYSGHLRVHEHTHLGARPYSCTWPGCGYLTGNKSHLVSHVRTKHFRLPASVRVQLERGIVDDRRAGDYIAVNQQVLQWADETLKKCREEKMNKTELEEEGE